LEARPEWYRALAPLVAERVKRLTEIGPVVRFLFAENQEMDPAAVESVLAKPGAGEALDALRDALASLGEWTPEAVEATLRSLPEGLGIKSKTLFQLARVAVTGSTVSLPLFESIALLGRETTLARLTAARALAAQ
jgi:glutamyl-tRNA synthetase